MTHAMNRVRRTPALFALAASALAVFSLPTQAAVPGIAGPELQPGGSGCLHLAA